ncbi:MAG: hypothetical protein P1U58_09875 [Verrucomicrobiales bacterium]|nr:hypothetical protein [Verrucomicrobiales bacterium]
MTWIEVADSAVKIGLGGVIGIFGTVAVALIKGSHERKGELRKRKLDTLERVAGDFQEAHVAFNDMIGTFKTFLESDCQTSFTIRHNRLKQQVFEIYHEKKRLLFHLNGELILVRSKGARSAFAEYFCSVTEIESLVFECMNENGKMVELGLTEKGGFSAESLRKLDSLSSRVPDIRARFLSELSDTYHRT